MQSGPARAAVFAACCDCVNLLTMSGVLGSADGHSRGGSSLRDRRRAAARARLVSQQATSADQRSARTELRHIAAFRRCGRPDPADVRASALHGYARDPEVLAMGALLIREGFNRVAALGSSAS